MASPLPQATPARHAAHSADRGPAHQAGAVASTQTQLWPNATREGDKR